MADLRKLVQQYGGELYAGGRAATIPGPGHSKKDRSLSLKLSDDGERVIFHSFSGNSNVREIMDYLGIEAQARPQTAEERARYLRLRDHERKVRAEQARREAAADLALCQHIWAGTVPLGGTIAETYLYGRGLIIEASDVAFHPAAPRSKDPDKAEMVAPAMVSMVRTATGAPQSLHLTYLKPDGSGKLFKLMFGSPTGCTVQLAPIGDDRVLALGEGIETSAAYTALHGVPAWAGLSTSGLQNFVLPARVRKLIIAADGDLENRHGVRAGLLSATNLAERMCKLCEVEIHAAPDGQDWADVLAARS